MKSFRFLHRHVINFVLLCSLVVCFFSGRVASEMWDHHKQMKGISLFGLETDHRGFMCDWVHPVDHYMNEIAYLGFNMIRVPFSYQYFIEGNLGLMDHIVDVANHLGISIVLDFHRVWSNTQQPTPFDYGMTEEQFQSTWMSLLTRYQNSPSVCCHNAYNEFVPDDAAYLMAYTRRLFEKVEAAFPGRYMHAATGTRWSGSLRGVTLEDLPYTERIFYSVHKYSFSGSGNEEDWENSFGNVGLPLERVIVGEWGWVGTDQGQVDWANNFISYLNRKNVTNTIYWSLSQSGDTGNLYADDCVTFRWDNYNILRTLWRY